MSCVLDLVVPGAGSAADVLVSILTLCAEMKEGQAACRRLHGRLADLQAELGAMAESGHLPTNDATGRYIAVLAGTLEYLERYRRRSLVSRLARHAQAMDELQRLKEDVDAMFKMLNLATTAKLMEWKQQSEAEAREHKALLVAMTKNAALLLKEFETHRAQMEAMMLLRHEMDRGGGAKRDDKGSGKGDAKGDAKERGMAPHVRAMYLTLVKASATSAPKVPEWLLPLDDVQYDPEPFARGSFGPVHHGVWGSGTKVVVKCLAAVGADNDSPRQSKYLHKKFVEEINLWHKFNHPNVLKMFGASHVSSPPFIVCEDATSNGNLAAFLAASSANKQLAWRLLLQVAFGLEYVHKWGVVHGDLKLNNILVGADGLAKVADFGLSVVHVLPDKPNHSKLAKARKPPGRPGNLRWCAPECLDSRPTPASDVYSLAMCFIEAVSGEPPSAFIDDEALTQMLKNGKIPSGQRACPTARGAWSRP